MARDSFRALSLPLGVVFFFAHVALNAFFVTVVIDNLPTTFGIVLRILMWPLGVLLLLSMFVTPILLVKYVGKRVRIHEQRMRQV